MPHRVIEQLSVPFDDHFIEEAMPLFRVHYSTINHYPDLEFDPDFNNYKKLHELGMVRVFTAREKGELLGYAIFFVRTNLRYRKSLQAVQDVLFIHPEKRGFGAGFVAWCDEQLRAEGVQVVYHHVKSKPELNFSPMLERQGYELIDLIYGKRLDLGKGT